MSSKSKSKFSFSYIAMLFVAAFAAWVYFHELKGGIERDKEKSEAAALLPFSNDKVEGVRLLALTEGAGPTEARHETIVKKVSGTWRVEKPYADLGDAVAVDSFLSTVSQEKIGETVVEANDIVWKTYGLDSPSAEAEITAKVDGVEKRRTIKVGSVPAFDGSVYARIDGADRVVLMSSTTLAALQKDARDFRDKRLFPEDVQPNFTEFEVSRTGAAKLHVVLKDGTWSDATAKTADWPLDQEAVKSYVKSVAGMRGNDVWAEDKFDPKVIKQRKLDRPGILISLKADKHDPYVIKVAALEKTEQVAAGTGSQRPLVFSIYKASIDQLSKSIDAFRDLRFPFQFKLAEIRVAELARAAGEVSLPKLNHKDGKWLIDPTDANFQSRSLKPGLVEKLMVDLEGLSAKQILPPGTAKPRASAKGAIRVSLFGETNQKLVEFGFEPVGETIHVSSSKVPNRIFEIEKANFEALGFDLVEAEAPSKVTPANPPSATPKGTP